jgi:hypothetical protein
MDATRHENSGILKLFLMSRKRKFPSGMAAEFLLISAQRHFSIASVIITVRAFCVLR